MGTTASVDHVCTLLFTSANFPSTVATFSPSLLCLLQFYPSLILCIWNILSHPPLQFSAVSISIILLFFCCCGYSYISFCESSLLNSLALSVAFPLYLCRLSLPSVCIFLVLVLAHNAPHSLRPPSHTRVEHKQAAAWIKHLIVRSLSPFGVSGWALVLRYGALATHSAPRCGCVCYTLLDTASHPASSLITSGFLYVLSWNEWMETES